MPDLLNLNIPLDIRTPGQYIEVDASRAIGTLPVQSRRLLVMGQRLSTGTVAAAVPTLITRAADADTCFGRGSMLARMLKALFLTPARDREVWAVALDDAGAGVVATQTITLTGPASAAGTLCLYVVGVRVAVAVAVADTATAVAAALASAINAQSDLPVTAAADAGVVTVTARHKGVTGNQIDLRVNYYVGERTPTGLTVTIAAGVTGTTNPDLTTALAAIAAESFYTLVTPYTDTANLEALDSELSTRWGPLDQRTGHAFGALDGTHAQLLAVGAAVNSPHLSLWGQYQCPTWAPERAAVLAGVCEYYGAIDPARPLQHLDLPGVLASAVASRFTRAERDQQLHHGLSTTYTAPDGTCMLERVVTTYQTDAAGVEDPSFLDLETKWTADYLRYAVRVRIALRFPRHKLADDDTRFAPGQAVATPRIIRAELIALMRDLEEAGLVERLDDLRSLLIVERSASDANRVNALIPPNLVNQFRVFAASVQFRL